MKKKQHYVPKMMLKNFTIDDSEHCWEYNLNSKKITKKRIEEICASNYLYEIRDEHGNFLDPSKINVMENGFCEIENRLTPFFDELLNRISDEDLIFLSQDEIETIYVWMSLMF